MRGKKLTWRVGQRVKAIASGEGGGIIKTYPSKDSPYKVRWDRQWMGQTMESWENAMSVEVA